MRIERLRLVAVGVAAPLLRPLVFACAKMKLAFEPHGKVVHPRHYGREALQPFVHQRLHHFENFGIISSCRVHGTPFFVVIKRIP